MWKVFEKIRDDWDKDKQEIESSFKDDQKKTDNFAKLVETSIQEGAKLVSGDNVTAPCDGTIEGINDNAGGIEIYFDQGYAVYVEFMLVRPVVTLLVHAGQSVKKGETLVRFTSAMTGAQVYLITPEIESDYSGQDISLLENDIDQQ